MPKVTEITEPNRRRRTYGIEREWFDLAYQVGGQGLRRGFIKCGVPREVAGNLAWFIFDQMELVEFNQSESTRNRYRHELARLDQAEVRARAFRDSSTCAGGPRWNWCGSA
jgi:hypothetical protein